MAGYSVNGMLFGSTNSVLWFHVLLLALIAAILLCQLWRGHDPADASELRAECLCLSGTRTQTHTPTQRVSQPLHICSCMWDEGFNLVKVHLALLTPQSNIPSRPPIVASLGLSVALCLTADASPLIHSTPHLPGRRTRGHGLSIRWLHWIGVRIEVIKKKDETDVLWELVNYCRWTLFFLFFPFFSFPSVFVLPP